LDDACAKDHPRAMKTKSIRKYLSLKEARERRLLERFCKEHPSKGDERMFDRLLDAMAKPKNSAEDEQT
jgi:hypothetical protein